jgi:hypothetical protein
MKTLKRELIVFLIVLLSMAAFWHNVTFFEKATLIFSSSRPFHPLEWGMTGYLALWIPRGIYLGIKKLISKKRAPDDNPSDKI